MLRRSVLAIMFLASGCGLSPHSKTIGQIGGRDVLLDDVPLPRVSHQDVRDEYRNLLEDVDDKELREQIERRIAGVYMLEGDYKQVMGVAPPAEGYFAPAIESYQEVIAKYPGDSDNAESLYQLAKAYDLDGKDQQALGVLDSFIQDYPDSARLPEVYFRKGDIHFRHGQYEEAQKAYLSVIATGQDSAFINNSYYLLGWSRYKLGEYEKGMESFAEVLDRLVPEDGKVPGRRHHEYYEPESRAWWRCSGDHQSPCSPAGE
jgi:tetratricopeptide (TPR) repeat protein